ncbi:unnamed protein product [Lactuca saligna]|uniref:Ribulose bisphosphate carboxylase large chain n=1 Tax=Lactuca saligna TaxID=75948 RepID=A0AA35VFH5_LACSI|nr:unnamed protein product [Lactuca saligna]
MATLRTEAVPMDQHQTLPISLLQYLWRHSEVGYVASKGPRKSNLGGMTMEANLNYKLTCYTLEYETKDTDILAAFRVIPQPGVPPEEVGVVVVVESSTGTWRTVWNDGLTSLDRYKGRCYGIEPVPREEDQYIAYVAYPANLLRNGDY